MRLSFCGVVVSVFLRTTLSYAQVQDGSVPPEPSQNAAASTTIPAPPQTRRLSAVVFDTAIQPGIDPVVSQQVTLRLRETVVAMGYELTPPEQTSIALATLNAPLPPSPADLWRLTFVAHAQRGLAAHVWAEGGQYVCEIEVASLDGAGPFMVRSNASANDLLQTVDSDLRKTLPPPGQWDAERAQYYLDKSAEAAPLTPESNVEPITPSGPLEIVQAPPPSTWKRHRFGLALQTEAVFGSTQEFFYNHLLGVRADYRISSDIFLGAYIGYANLRGKAQRESNLLTYGQVENRVQITATSRITIPLRIGIGYLPYNGPVIRLAAGLNIPVGEHVEIAFDLITPTFWVLPHRTAMSLNLAGEVAWRF